MAQDNSHSRGPKGGPPGNSPPESAPTVPEMPAVDVGEKRSSSAPTVPMKPVRPGERGIHSAPTVPMKPVRFSDLVPEEAPPAKAASRPAPPPEPSRTQVSRPAVPAAASAPPPAAPAQPSAKPVVAPAPASEASRSVPAVTKFAERPAADRAVTTSPGRTAVPPKRPAEEPPTDVPRKAGQSTSVMLKASHLHKLAEQAEKERKFALTRKGSSRSTRAPFPSVRPPTPEAAPPERPLPPVPAASLPPATGPRPALGSNPRVLLGGETTGPQRVHRPDVNLVYDGRAPAEGLSITHPETSLRAPVQSYPGQRTVIHTQNVINQYAVAVNPRYAPRAQEPRDSGHLFVFDVMNSQHTTLERAFAVGSSGNSRPGTAAELWKWLNETALSRGWRTVEGPALQEAAAKGLPIIAMAKTPAGPRFAVVEPGPLGPGGKPLLASAHGPRGQRLTPEQIFGSSAVRYLAHD